MSTEAVVLRGTLRPDGSLELDGKVPLPSGPVEVTVRPLAPTRGEDLPSLLARIRAEQQAAGHVPRTREQIDEEVRRLRDEWDEHQAAVERLQEECCQLRLPPAPPAEPPA